MDTTTITHLSLCSGYGGIDLGLRRAIGSSLRTVAYAEIEAFACELLLARMEGRQIDPAPIWPDLKSFPWSEFSGRVDILSGGYPCQPFSAAGKRLGKDDPRHLWPFIADGIQILRPRLCFFENVEGHISLGLRDVIEELGRLGYKTTWGIFSASEVGAPHQRKRVFILAYRDHGRSRENQLLPELRPAGIEQPSGCPRVLCSTGEAGEITIWPSRPGEPQHGWEPPRVVGNSQSIGFGLSRHEALQGDRGHADGTDAHMGNAGGERCEEAECDVRSEQQPGGIGEECGLGVAETMGNASLLNGAGQARGQWETQTGRTDTARNVRQTQPSLGRDSDGSTYRLDDAELFISCDNRTDELRLLGNGVVPATAALAFQTLLQQLNKAHSQ